MGANLIFEVHPTNAHFVLSIILFGNFSYDLMTQFYRKEKCNATV